MPIPADLKQALAEGRVVPFVGAGVSMNVRGPHGAYGGEQKRLFPSWSELLEAARARMKNRDPDSAAFLDVSSALKKGDLLTAADSAIDALGDRWPELVEQALDPSLEGATGLELARAVWTLGSRLVVTTNYDRVLGFTSGDLCAARWVVSSPGGMARYLARPKVGRPIVWHLHGHVDDPTQMVLGNASYAQLYDEATGGQRPDWRAAIATLRSLFTGSTGHVVLFVGFSMADAYVRAVLAGVLTTFDGAAPSPYILCRRQEADALRNLGQASGITLIPVPVDDFGAPMVDALREMSRIAGGQSPGRALAYAPAGPPPAPAAPLPADWPPAVQAHPLFAQVGDGPWRDRLLATVEQCAKARADARTRTLARVGDEPWSDDAFTGRVLARLAELIPDAGVSPPEAALLLAAPCLAEAVRALSFAALAERADLLRLAPAEGERRRMRQLLENAHQAHPALLRRVERLGDDVRGPIATWLGWRALDRATHLWSTGDRDPATALLTTIDFGPLGAALSTLGQSVGATASALDEPTGARQRPDLLIDDRGVRVAELGTLLALASAAALDPRVSDTTPLDHLAVDDDFDLPRLLAAIAGARWTPGNKAWNLAHDCRHPVEQHALTYLAARAHTLATALHPGNDPPPLLTRLPGALNASDVGAAADGVGHPLYDPTLVRFQLDHRRVRELLMGEQLYGDPTLAIRELYQNALDACRYRRARDAWIRLDTDDPDRRDAPAYEGHIHFRQGHDKRGRPYIECEDDGVGLDRRTLQQVFAVAGRRFHDLPTFLAEKAKWRAALDDRRCHLGPDDPDRRAMMFEPNSQHGIGVLSYFMLADDLEVVTRRFGADGKPGQALRVSICSASGLFRIKPLPDTDVGVGTLVRLFLSSEECKDREGMTRRVSVREALMGVLVVAEFPVRVEERDRVETWSPDIPHPGAVARVLRSRSRLVSEMPDDALIVWPAGPGLWWASIERAPVLADGLLTDETCPWVMVDLQGAQRPRLSADRRKILEWARHDALAPLVDGVATAVQNASSFARLWSLVERYPRLGRPLHDLLLTRGADLVSPVKERARTRGGPPPAPHQIPYSAVGWYSPDAGLVGRPRSNQRTIDLLDADRLAVWSPFLPDEERLIVRRPVGLGEPFLDPIRGMALKAARQAGSAMEAIQAAASVAAWREILPGICLLLDRAGLCDVMTRNFDRLAAARLGEHDLPLLPSDRLKSRRPQLTLGHVCRAAHTSARSIADVASRLVELWSAAGFPTQQEVEWLAANGRHSVPSDVYPDRAVGPIAALRVLRMAIACEISLNEAARALRYTLGVDHGGAFNAARGPLDATDAFILAYAGVLDDDSGIVDSDAMSYAARALDRPIEVIAERLRPWVIGLGGRMAEAAALRPLARLTAYRDRVPVALFPGADPSPAAWRRSRLNAAMASDEEGVRACRDWMTILWPDVGWASEPLDRVDRLLLRRLTRGPRAPEIEGVQWNHLLAVSASEAMPVPDLVERSQNLSARFGVKFEAPAGWRDMTVPSADDARLFDDRGPFQDETVVSIPALAYEVPSASLRDAVSGWEGLHARFGARISWQPGFFEAGILDDDLRLAMVCAPSSSHRSVVAGLAAVLSWAGDGGEQPGDVIRRLRALDEPLGLGLRFTAEAGSALDGALACVAAHDPPHDRWSPNHCLAEVCKHAGQLAHRQSCPADEALRLAGRRWLWWLTDDEVAPIAALLRPHLDLEPSTDPH